MENKQISMLDILLETHIGLARQGPGSYETTFKALGYINNLSENSLILDLGCGTGGQTITIARNFGGKIIGVDQFPEFIDVLNENAVKSNLGDRVKGIVGSMEKLDDLSFSKEEFDVIWCEGAIDSIGFEKGLSYWKAFLKTNGYVAVTCPSWLTGEQPNEVEKFWGDAGSKLDTVEYNTTIMQKCGYDVVAAFVLPNECWIDNYFTPRTAAEKAFAEKYPNNETMESYLESSKNEMDLYSKHKKYYGYVFYIGKKV